MISHRIKAMAESTKIQKYEAWRAGELSDEEAREFFADEWESVQKMEQVRKILADQPEPDLDRDDLLF